MTNDSRIGARLARLRFANPREATIAFLIAALFEGVLTMAALGSMGHAGPQGPFALVGWVALLLNLPGILVITILFRVLSIPSEFSLMPAILAVYLIQSALFASIIYLLMVYNKQRPTTGRILRFSGLVICGVLIA